jgi:hypothetical protein
MEKKSIAELAENVKAAGLKWTDLLSRHSVAVQNVADDRNEIAGEIYNARREFEALLDCLCVIAQRKDDGQGELGF